MITKVAILGSTGSIGANTLDVISRNLDRFQLVALAAGSRVDVLEQQIRRFRPRLAALYEEQKLVDLRQRLAGLEVELCGGEEGLMRVATLPEADLVVAAIVGGVGLTPTMGALLAGKDIALANKETMVMAGELITREAKGRGRIIPVDSEHSAIFQSLNGQEREGIRRLILTASGGPFRTHTLEQLQRVSAAEALRHPNWEMGNKITIDSATLMNKGLEVIEAKWLFDVAVDQVQVVIHPQSIIHSMVEFTDGSVIAQLGIPDMRVPISYALGYPHRLANDLPSLDLVKVGKLTFEEPDLNRFPCLRYAYEALREGQGKPAALNAVNEVAVDAFLKGQIRFHEIHEVIAATLDSFRPTARCDLEEILRVDRWARQQGQEVISAMGRRG